MVTAGFDSLDERHAFVFLFWRMFRNIEQMFHFIYGRKKGGYLIVFRKGVCVIDESVGVCSKRKHERYRRRALKIASGLLHSGFDAWNISELKQFRAGRIRGGIRGSDTIVAFSSDLPQEASEAVIQLTLFSAEWMNLEGLALMVRTAGGNKIVERLINFDRVKEMLVHRKAS